MTRLKINGHDAAEVKEILRRRNAETRVYLAGAASGIGQSVSTELWVLNDKGEEFNAGTNFLLGSAKEMPWSNEILWKFDITHAVHEAGVDYTKNIKFHFKIVSYNSSLIAEAPEYAIFAVREAYTDYLTLVIPIGVSYPLPTKLIVPKRTHIKFIPVSEEYNVRIENLLSYSHFNKCSIPPFSFHAYDTNVVYSLEPGDYYFASSNQAACTKGQKIYLHVQDH